jgi:hypothetical protein
MDQAKGVVVSDRLGHGNGRIAKLIKSSTVIAIGVLCTVCRLSTN